MFTPKQQRQKGWYTTETSVSNRHVWAKKELPPLHMAAMHLPAGSCVDRVNASGRKSKGNFNDLHYTVGYRHLFNQLIIWGWQINITLWCSALPFSECNIVCVDDSGFNLRTLITQCTTGPRSAIQMKREAVRLLKQAVIHKPSPIYHLSVFSLMLNI